MVKKDQEAGSRSVIDRWNREFRGRERKIEKGSARE